MALAGIPALVFIFVFKSFIILIAVIAVILATVGLCLPLKCCKCGNIPLRELPPRERKRIIIGKVFTIITLVIILGAGSVALIAWNEFK
jgi:hypothetical protein